MEIISNLRVNVSNIETEIIVTTQTSKDHNRRFGIGNGDKEITATVMGSDDGGTWGVEKSENILPNNYKAMIVGPSHYPWVKLKVKTVFAQETSIVDAYLTYPPPSP